jgi:outer membrane protein assembly factor BamB
MPPTLSRLLLFGLVLVSALSAPVAVRSADWIHWRGPEQSGVSKEKGLPGDFDPPLKEKGNVIWQQPFGGRSAPLIMDGRLYIIQGTGAGLSEGEQVVCVEEATGKKLWHYRVNVYHTDIVSSRLGWTTLTADPEAGYVYAHSTAGELLCLDKAGKLVWSRQLTEEFGRVTGYGGRIVSPIFDSGLVIVGIASSSWGDQARGQNRFVAFDGKTGKVVWITGVGEQLYGTYYSSPVIAVINGQRLFIAGGADGALHALKVRTGEEVWSYEFAAGAINGSPVVHGNLVYCTHGEENPEGGPIGRVICVDGSQVTDKKPKLVWDSYKRVYKQYRNTFLSERFGLASAALSDGYLYCPSDKAELFCFRAKDGELLWKAAYGTEARGSPLVADGKLYIFDVKAKIVILTLNGDKAPNPVDTFDYRFPGQGGLLCETNGTPVAVNGRVYFTTRTDLYCIGDPEAKPSPVKYNPLPNETQFKENAIAGVRLFPADVNAKPGEKIQFQVVYFDENGREVKDNRPTPKATWTLPQPPIPKGAKTAPPALQGKLEDGTLTLATIPSQQGYVEFECGPKARARVRVVPQIAYKHDFDKITPGGVPGGWVNTAGKYFVKKLDDGSVVLAKVNDNSRPPIARANAYITGSEATDYTIQADVYASLARNKLPDLGLINCRYLLTLDGKIDPATGKLSVRLISWEARPRVDKGISFDWKADTWYTMKFTVEPTEKGATLRGKVWPKSEKEPENWTIEFNDPYPNRAGAAALYGYVPNVTPLAGGGVQPGSDIYYDNVSVTPNKK